MALDRKISIGLQVSELLADPAYEGEDVEVRQEMGRAELRKNFGMLVRGRDRPNGILGEGEELSAPDTLVKGALYRCFSPSFHGLACPASLFLCVSASLPLCLSASLPLCLSAMGLPPVSSSCLISLCGLRSW